MKIRLLLLIFLLAITTIHAQTYHWGKSVGGTSDGQGRSITTDASGNVYTTGIFRGTADFDPGAGIANHTSVGGQDFFVQKLDAHGNFLWAKTFGSTSDEYGESIALDPSGNVYTAGSFAYTVDFDPGVGITNLTATNGACVFVQKFDASGNFLWARAFGGYEALSVATDISGNVYTTGDFGLTADFDPGTGIANLTSPGGYQVFVQKMDAAGNFQWAKSLGGTGDDFGQSITTDVSGNVYTTGRFRSTGDFDPGTGTANLTSAGGDDIFVQKMDASGNFLWAKALGGTYNDEGHSISADASGNVYTTGEFGGTADFDPGTGTANLISVGAYSDAFVQKMDASGNFQWAKSWGGTNDERGYSISADAAGNVYTTGFYSGIVDFDPGAGTANLGSNTGIAVFIQKMDASGNFQWAKCIVGTSSEISYSIKADTYGNVYTTGWFAGTADFDPGTGTANLTVVGGSSNIFVQKLRQCTSTSGTDVITTCGPYTWIDGVTYTSSNNTATHVLTNATSCDSTVTLKLTVKSNTGTDIITACNSYTWIDGNTYTASNNTATHVLTNVAGCDSTVTLHLTINSGTGTDVITACNSYTWIDGNTYTASNNTATHTLTNAAGCDSTVNLDLTIHAASTGTDVFAVCGSFTWIDGNTYTSSNHTATHTLMNAAGCDSIVSLDLTIYPASTGTDIVTACGSYTWIDGNTYTSSNNTATHTLINAAGCDSIVSLDLTISIASAGTDVVTACGSYTWIDGNTYTSSNNTATHTLTNAAGCDSVVTLNLTIHSVSDITTVLNGTHISANNPDATYQWLDCDNNFAIISGATDQDFAASANGNYAVALTENGCVDTSACVEMKSVGIAENDFGNEMNIFPNPTDGNFSIDLGSAVERAEISITDIAGKEIYARSFTQTQVVNLSIAEPAGFYFVTVHSGEKKAIFKLVKE